MAHCIVPEAEAILDREFPVLDKGFVRLVDYYGGDARIVQSARVSYGDGTKTVREDAALIDYLLRNEFYVPADDDIALQSTDNKQGRSTESVSPEFAAQTKKLLEQGQQDAYRIYTELVDSGLARELARINLPLALYTEIYWQCDLHNLMHFLKLRLDSHAQKEIRDYAAVILELTRKVAPVAVASFENHIKSGISFSGEEMEALRAVLDGKENPLTGKKLERFTAKVEYGIQK